MLTISYPADYSMSGSVEEPIYTDLQPVIMDSSCFITSSSDPCLPDFVEDVSCVECVVESEDTFSTTDQQGCCLYTLPESPESLIEDDCSMSGDDLLHTQLYEESQVCDEEEDDDDDDASVMLDFMDLSFLDEQSASVEKEVEGGNGQRSFLDSLDACPTVIVKPNPGYIIPEFQRFTSSSLPPTPTPSPSSSPTHTTSPRPEPALTPADPTNPIAAATTTTTTTTTSTQPSTIPTTTLTFHYCDDPTTYFIIEDSAVTVADTMTAAMPPSPPESTGSPVLVEIVSTQTDYTRRERKKKGGQKEKKTSGDAAAAMDFDSFDNSDDDDNAEDAGYKPYCDSRRGAKRNLLWKFLLWTLDHHSDVVCWTDVKKGVFKFVDTARVSTLWGQRKRKHDMTFEKLSRGIRHYYKRGLMERLSHTRLMYKFNWDKVPRKYRKA